MSVSTADLRYRFVNVLAGVTGSVGTRLTSGVVNPKRKQAWLRLPHLAIAGLAALIGPADHAGAGGSRSERSARRHSQFSAPALRAAAPDLRRSRFPDRARAPAADRGRACRDT